VVVVRAYRLVGLLEEISGTSAMVTALRELRARHPDPPGLERYLPPDTDSSSLAALAQHVEILLREGRDDDAVALELATIAMLQGLVPRAVELDPSMRWLEEHVEHLRRDIEDAREPG
jgi:hypothetical protein